MEYDQVLTETVADFESLVEKWKAEEKRKQLAPAIKRQKLKNGFWEWCFILGSGIGVITILYSFATNLFFK